MLNTLSKNQILNVLYGATLLGGGGGGSLQDGLNMYNKYFDAHPKDQLKLIDFSEMHGKYAAVTAGMGAPSKIQDVDFSIFSTNAFNALKEMAAKLEEPKELSYSIAVEMGGFNTFVPMLISLVNNIPFVDGDGSGRAVPALDTLLLHINGCNTSPLAMANGKNDKVTINLEDPKDAALAEEIGRHICMAFDYISGLSGWMVTEDDVKNRIVDGSITLAEKIGSVILSNDGNSIYEELQQQGIVDAKTICNGIVTYAETVQESGFDRGVVIVDDTWKIDFQNENLLLSKLDGEKSIPWMTVPDIITLYDRSAKDNRPLTNADIKKDMKVSLGCIRVDKKWELNPNMFDSWKKYLSLIHYEGDRISFDQLK